MDLKAKLKLKLKNHSIFTVNVNRYVCWWFFFFLLIYAHAHKLQCQFGFFLLDINKLMYLERIERNGEDFDEFFLGINWKILSRGKGQKQENIQHSTFEMFKKGE